MTDPNQEQAQGIPDGTPNDLLTLGHSLAQAEAVAHAANPFPQSVVQGLANIQVSDPNALQNPERNARARFLTSFLAGAANSLGQQYNAEKDAQITTALANMLGGNPSGLDDSTLSAPLEAGMKLFRAQQQTGRAAQQWKMQQELQNQIQLEQAKATAAQQKDIATEAAKGEQARQTEFAKNPWAKVIADQIGKNQGQSQGGQAQPTDSSQGGPLSGMDPDIALLALPKELQKQAYDERTLLTKGAQAQKQVNQAFADLATTTRLGRAMPAGKQAAFLAVAQAHTLDAFREISGSLRLPPAETDKLMNSIASIMSSPAALEVKQAGINRLINRHMVSPTLDALGLKDAVVQKAMQATNFDFPSDGAPIGSGDSAGGAVAGKTALDRTKFIAAAKAANLKQEQAKAIWQAMGGE